MGEKHKMIGVIIMRMIKNLQNFLYDQDYFIDIYNNCLHVYYYDDLLNLNSSSIELKLKEFTLKIEGKDLVVREMDKHEILIKGIIENMRFER